MRSPGVGSVVGRAGWWPEGLPGLGGTSFLGLGTGSQSCVEGDQLISGRWHPWRTWAARWHSHSVLAGGTSGHGSPARGFLRGGRKPAHCELQGELLSAQDLEALVLLVLLSSSGLVEGQKGWGCRETLERGVRGEAALFLPASVEA